ncbi:MAG: hypothetical protein K0S33_686 [Bacteroidetes bacterium]|jgi:hypothetical protein|nr:hypothetical protein [Bacteroidota bacterium]
MTTQAAFPHFFAIASNHNPLWGQEIIFDDVLSIEGLLGLYDQSVDAANSDTEMELAIAKSFCNDLIDLRGLLPAYMDVLLFLQFQICTSIIQILYIKKLSNLQFDWIANSLSNLILSVPEREYEIWRIDQFVISDNSFVCKYFKPIFYRWSKLLFYYCRITGGHKAIVVFHIENYLEPMISDVNGTVIYQDLVGSFMEFQSFAKKNKLEHLATLSSEILYYYYSLPNLPENISFLIAFQFSCMGFEDTPLSRQDWCNVVQNKFGSKLRGHYKMQLLINKYENNYELLCVNFDKLLLAISSYHHDLEALNLNFHELKYELSRIFSILDLTIVRFLFNGDLTRVNALIGHYFRIPTSDLIKPTNLAIVPNSVQGVLYSAQNRVTTLGNDSTIYFPTLNEVLNKFLRLTHAINDDLSISIIKPDKDYGFPNYKISNELEALLVKIFEINKCATFSGVDAFYFYSALQFPLQALIVKYQAIALPITLSFMDPLKETSVTRVLVWQGDCMLSELECDVVQEIFEKRGVTVTRFNWHNATKAEFIAEYQQDKYDIVWISCHGEFDHYYPENSFLVLNREEATNDTNVISYGELITDLKSNNRRLLVLNACDGATTSLTSSPVAIGLGASMVNRNQSLISHQWPIDDLAGMTYGIILAYYLTETDSYVEAYKRTVLEFLKGKESIISFIKKVSTNVEVIDRLENRQDIDLSLIYYWGSLSLVQ